MRPKAMRVARLALVLDQRGSRPCLTRHGSGAKGASASDSTTGPGTRTAAAMGRREGLVQVDVHGVDAEVARPHPADDGVEIGAVAVEVGARLVHGLGDLDDLALEQPAGVGVGQHDRGDLGPDMASRTAFGSTVPSSRAATETTL